MTEECDQVTDILKKSKRWMMLFGALSVFVGMVSIGAPLLSGIAATIFIGSMLVVAGVAEIVHGFHARHGGKAVAFLKGFLALVAGGLILARPILGLATLTLVLAAYFVVDGIMWCIMAFQVKPQGGGWGWVLFNGIITLVLGIMIWSSWPLSGVWAVGVLVGIRILIAGINMLFLGSVTGEVAKQVCESEEE